VSIVALSSLTQLANHALPSICADVFVVDIFKEMLFGAHARTGASSSLKLR
jgi:hypothetical protein